MEWWNSQVGKREYFEAKIKPGIRMHLHFDSELAYLIHCDDFELRERQFMNAFLRPGDVFVDVGANIGLFALIAARLVGSLGKVYAFEPTTEIYKRLCQNVKLNRFQNIACFQLALSDKGGKFPFFTSEDGFDAWNSFAKPIEGETFCTEWVKCARWDDFAAGHHLIGEVTMIKIDVEGWESRVLEGGRQFLARNDAPVLQIEFTEEASESAGFSCAQLYHQLEDFGYKMFIYNPLKREIRPDPLRESYPYLNLIATKNADMIRERIKRQSVLFRLKNWR